MRSPTAKLPWLALLIFIAACVLGPGNFQSRQSTDLTERNIRRIAILPVDGTVLEPVKPGAETNPNSLLTRSLYTNMTALGDWHIISDREVQEALQRLGMGDDGVRARKLGEIVYADAVLSGRVLRFRQRVGGDLGVKSPASVAFVVELHDARRGDVVWSARFDETQRPLSENIFGIGEFAQRGARFLTAEELTVEGVKKAVQQLHKALYG